MLPANLHFKDLYDSTVEFFTARSTLFSFGDPATEETDHIPPSDLNHTSTPEPIARSTREYSPIRERLGANDWPQNHVATCSCHPDGDPASGLTPHSMRRELEISRNELARSQSEVMKLEERYKTLEKTLRDTKEMLKARDAEVEKLRRDRSNSDLGRSSQDYGENRDYRPPQRHGIEGQYHRRPSAEKRRSAEQRQSIDKQRGESGQPAAGSSGSSISGDEEDRAQQRGLETFLTKTDRWSGAQVIQAVQDLNSEVLQFAASSTDMCVFTSTPPSRKKDARALQDTTTRLGPHITRFLSTKDHAQDPLLVQLALQGCISTCIARAMSSFCIGLQPKSNDLLSQIYSHMHFSEPQPTSSRWRSLTHKFVHSLNPGLQDHAFNELVETIFRWSLDIFTVAGGVHAENGTSLKDSLRLRFSTQVQRIARAVCKLAQVTREEIMSTDFEVLAIDHGGIFDGKRMADVFGEYGPSRGTILCTVELGLSAATRRSSGEVPSVEKEGAVERRLLLQPKVVLESVVDVLYPS